MEVVLCGLPTLGPLLFSLYVNEFKNIFKHCTVHNFADDANLLYVNKDITAIIKI